MRDVYPVTRHFASHSGPNGDKASPYLDSLLLFSFYAKRSSVCSFRLDPELWRVVVFQRSVIIWLFYSGLCTCLERCSICRQEMRRQSLLTRFVP